MQLADAGAQKHIIIHVIIIISCMIIIFMLNINSNRNINSKSSHIDNGTTYEYRTYLRRRERSKLQNEGKTVDVDLR